MCKKVPFLLVSLLLSFVLVVLIGESTIKGSWIDLRSMTNFRKNVSLTHDILKRHSFNVPFHKRKVVILTAATKNYAPFVYNLHCSVSASSGRDLIIFSLDPEIFQQASDRGYPTVRAFYEHERLVSSSGPYIFGSNEFNVITRLKLSVVRDALHAGYDVIFTDADIVWCDRVPELILLFAQQIGRGDIFIQNAVDPDDAWPVVPNTGFFYAVSRPGVVELFDELVNLSESGLYSKVNDQELFKRIVCRNSTGEGAQYNDTNMGPSGHFCAWRGNRVEVVLLPLAKYPHGRNPFNTPYWNFPKGYFRQACLDRRMAIWHNNWCKADQKFVKMDFHSLWSVENYTGKCTDM